MCDYSLHTYPNRLAADGEDLVVHRFGAGSLGLASPADLAPVISAGKMAGGTFWSQVKAWFLGLTRDGKQRNVFRPFVSHQAPAWFSRTFPKARSANWGSAK
jgi:hypothetical protein